MAVLRAGLYGSTHMASSLAVILDLALDGVPVREPDGGDEQLGPTRVGGMRAEEPMFAFPGCFVCRHDARCLNMPALPISWSDSPIRMKADRTRT